ncbi:MAG TPA: hypothetical protein VFT70_06255 [Nocardioides sp.]|nr:hypothetical protein [Nocardioides sp.]
MTTLPGLRLKQLVLAFGAAYLGLVALTNLVNLLSEATGGDWTFLNSSNTGYVASVVDVYSWPGWFDELAVAGASLVEGAGALLFARALLRYRGGGAGAVEAYQALAWNLGVWCAFIIGSEFFVAYEAEGTFRELLGLGLLMIVVVAVVPDDVARGTG